MAAMPKRSCPPDRAEGAADIDRASDLGNRMHGSVRVGIPRSDEAEGGEAGDAIPWLAANG